MISQHSGMLFAFTCFLCSTLTLDGNSMLARMFGGAIDSTRDSHGRVFIDRDGTHFNTILQWLRNGPSFELPKSLSEDQLQDLQLECDFYQLHALKELVIAAAVVKAHCAPMQYKSLHATNGRGDLMGTMDDINKMVAQGWRVHSVAGGSFKETLMYKAT
jgi:BTB/POZ domain